MRILVLVESPAKINKIKTILNSQNDGHQYIVAATVGHILALNSEKTLGVDLNNNYKPDYIPHPKKHDVIANLKKLKSNADKVWIASDLDQEGEFIGYSICHLLKLSTTETPRIIFNEITKTAILKAVKQPTMLDFNLLDAQKCRRVSDRLIGFLITRAAKTINDKLTVGRVQTIMVKLVIDREKEMEKFQQTLSYHTQGIFNDLSNKDSKTRQSIDAKLNKTFNDHRLVKDFLEDCRTGKFLVEDINERQVTKNPPAPLITSTLQSLVSRSLGISPKEVLDTAQALYQQGIISYPRTDCPKLPTEKMDECQQYLLNKYDQKYYQRREFKSKDSSAQEAHACIYPTKIELSELKDTEDFTYSQRQKRVYRFIWLYTVSSQMSPSETKVTKAQIGVLPEEELDSLSSDRPRTRSEKFIAENHTLTFEGYLKIWGKTAVAEEGDEENSDEPGEAEKQQNLSVLKLKVGQELSAEEIQSKQKASQGPAPYTESSLITQMKRYGVGRPSTYGQILSEVMNQEKKGFIYKTTKAGEKLKINLLTWKPRAKDEITEKTLEINQNAYRNRLYSTELGRAIDDFVNNYFSQIFNYGFTRELETKINQIESGDQRWHQVVDELYQAFSPTLKQFPTWRKKDDPDNPARKPKRQLGTYKDDNVYVYLAKYGPVIQIGEDDHPNKRYITLPKEYNLDKVTLQEINYLFGFPYDLGKLKDGRHVWLKKSQYGLYLDCRDGGKVKGKTYQVTEEMFDPDSGVGFDPTRSWEQQIDQLSLELIDQSISNSDKPKECIRQIEDIRIIQGKFGPYFIFNGVLVGIPKYQNVTLITYDECLHLYSCKIKKTRGGPKEQTKSTDDTTTKVEFKKKPTAKKKIVLKKKLTF